MKDHDEREYIVQVIKECDKNHRENDYNQSNEASIYAMPVKFDFFHIKDKHQSLTVT